MPRRRTVPRRPVTTTAATPAATAAPAPPAGGRPRPRPRPMAVVAALGAVVTLVSGVLGLVFVLRPQLKPQGPPAHTAVHLNRVSFDPRVTFAEYLRRSHLPAGDLDRTTLGRAGALLTLHYAIIGYEGKRLPLRWELLDVRSGRQVGEQQAITITGTAQEDEGDWQVWAPAPRRPGRYAIDVALLPPKGVVPLATLRGPEFAIGA